MKSLAHFFLSLFSLLAANLTAQNIYIYPEQALEFGDFTVSEAGGTVTVSDNGDRSSSGTTHLLNSYYHPAVFSISTDHPIPMEVLVEVSREALVNTEGNAMVLSAVSPATEVYTIQAGKPVKVVIGGILQMNSESFSPGEFHGNISIIVTRND